MTRAKTPHFSSKVNNETLESQTKLCLVTKAEGPIPEVHDLLKSSAIQISVEYHSNK